MWSMDYVQVPEERPEAVEEVKEEVVEESKEVIKEKKKAELVKQMSLSTDGGGKKNVLEAEVEVKEEVLDFGCQLFGFSRKRIIRQIVWKNRIRKKNFTLK